MKIEDIKLFITAAQLKSFTLTGKHFDLPRQTVSRRLSQLETDLGIRLLQRTTRRVELTELGQEFYQRWLQILEEIDYTNQLVSERQVKPAGLVNIAGPNEFGIMLLGQWLPELIATYPDLRLMLHSTEGTGQKPDLIVDLMIHIGRPADSSFVGFKLGAVNRTFYASPAFIEHYGEPKHPQELPNYRCVLNPVMGENYENWYWCDSNGEHPIQVQGALGSDTSSMAMYMAEQGLGVVWLPRFMTKKAVDKGRLIALFDGKYAQPLEIYALYPSRQFVPAKTRVVIDFIKSKLQDRLE
jgi:DNA-binding transcriptional LysR family regulator